MSQDVFVKFEYGARDILDAIRLRISSSPRGRAGLGACLVAALLAAVLFYEVGPGLIRHLVAWLAVLGFVHAAFTGLRQLPHAMFCKSSEDARWTQQVRSDFWNRKMSVDASEDGLTVTIGQRSATVRWGDCRRFASHARAYLIGHGEKGFLVVPRRVFRNEKKDAAFRDLATRLVRGVDSIDETPLTSMERPSPTPPAEARIEAHGESDALTASAFGPASTREESDGERWTHATSSVPKVGRNDPCPCGSGKKYKRCCIGSTALAKSPSK